MLSLFDLLLNVHRLVWFPVNYLLGLEASGVEMPAEFAPDASMGLVDPNSPALRRSVSRRTPVRL